MSAREKIIGMITGQYESDALRQVAARVADEILADHAHELAEKIRHQMVPLPFGATADYAQGQVNGLKEAANLIDPAHFSDSE